MRSRAPTLPTTAGPVCSPTRVRKPGRPRLCHLCDNSWPASTACRAARQALATWSASGSGACHDAVADILVDHAAIGGDGCAKGIEVARQPAGQQLGLHAFAEPREAFDVGEHHRDIAPYTADA